jgi:hypothetical protein
MPDSRLKMKAFGLSLRSFFAGVHIGTGDEVAIKLESVRSKHPQLLYESRVLRSVCHYRQHDMLTRIAVLSALGYM